jgi:hypothetical protein
MNCKGLVFTFVCAFLLSMFMACEKSINKDGDVVSSDTTSNGDSNTLDHESASDYSWDSTSLVHIVLNGSSITIDATGYASINGSNVTITKAANYIISGTLTDGQIAVAVSDSAVVRLILNGVTMNNSTTAPVFISKAQKAILVLANGTTNTIVDATTYVYASATENEPNAAIYSKAPLTLYGDGSLNVTGKYKDGITSKDGLIIKSGNITVNSADDGIRGKDYVIVRGGTTSVNSKGDGLKSDNEENTSMGFIKVESGKLNVIASSGDAMSAQTNVIITDGEVSLTAGGGSSVSKNESISTKGIKATSGITISGKTITVSSADDAIHTTGNVVINGGVINLSTSDDAIHGESSITINSGDITISKSYEAIESANITVKDGNISLVASNDGFNASKGLVSGGTESNDGSTLTISGGYIVVNVSNGDGLDSNGNITISGGTIIVHGPSSQPEVGIDYNGTCNVTGGFLAVSGTNSNMTQAPSTSSTQYCVKVLLTSSLSANTIFHIQDASGNDVLTFKPLRSYSSVILSSPSLKSGATYYIYTGGSSTGTEKNGLYQGGTYTAGASYANFTVSSIITSLGSSSPGPGR